MGTAFAAAPARDDAEWRVRVELAGTSIEGVATDVGDDGRLTVRTDDGSQTAVSAGDVVHLRPGGGPSG